MQAPLAFVQIGMGENILILAFVVIIALMAGRTYPQAVALVSHPLVAIILILAATKPNEFRVQRSVAIKAPADKIYPLIVDLKGWAGWSPYERKDPAMKRTFSGAPSGKGAVDDRYIPVATSSRSDLTAAVSFARAASATSAPEAPEAP